MLLCILFVCELVRDLVVGLTKPSFSCLQVFGLLPTCEVKGRSGGFGATCEQALPVVETGSELAITL